MAEQRTGGDHEWQLTVKGMTGDKISLTVAKPQEVSVLEVKSLIHKRDPELPPHQQRLIYEPASQGKRDKLEDGQKLASYPGLGNGSTLFLVRLTPCEVYVQDAHGRQHTLVVPSSEPQSYTVVMLRQLYEKQTGQSMDVYQFQFRGRPVMEGSASTGRRLTLGDYGIKGSDTLVVTKVGFILDVSNPQVDLCFMVDCTGSMQQWIDTVKNNVKDMRDKLDSEYRGCDLRFAFVRYTDYDQPASTRTTYIDFTKCQSSFHAFVSAIRADGGGDGPEDIMGGLKSTLYSLNWRNTATKVLIHIADCPCHGRQYHSMTDTYPNGDPAGITHEQMMGDVAQREVQYWFGYIQKHYTDQMIAIFNESLRRLSDNRLMIRQFDAIQPAEVGEAVHRAVTASIYAKEATKASVRSFTLDSTIPNWSSPMPPEQHGKKTPPPGMIGLKQLEEDFFTKLERPSVPFTFKCAANPFADGEEAIVFYAYDTSNRRQVVLKQFKREGGQPNSLECYMKVLEIREVAAIYAREFNTDKQKPPPVNNIEFAHVDIVQCSRGGCYVLQPFISGKFEKFNTNTGIVCTKSPHSQTLQAFSHFTWEKSGRTLLVCDLQGALVDGKLLLTDPAVHSRCDLGGRFGKTDSGYRGIQQFFNSHQCSDICQMMRLKPFST